MHPRAHPSFLHPLHGRWIGLTAALVVGTVYLVVSDRIGVGPGWWPLLAVVVFAVPAGAARQRGRHDLARGLALALTGVLTAAIAVSAFFLVTTLPRGTTQAGPLLFDATLIWLANTVIFALWYWEIDCGGPNARHVAYRAVDFAFPQLLIGGQDASGWCPAFVDYLFLSFNTSAAFSPTDTLILSVRAKLLMMVQSLISLVVMAFLAARAINTL